LTNEGHGRTDIWIKKAGNRVEREEKINHIGQRLNEFEELEKEQKEMNCV
jgi:hypothetical protein